MTISLSDVQVGDVLPPQTFDVDRERLVRYAGASGDFNTIHWSQEAATSVGLPDVIAHGMLTMGTVIRVVTDWVGDPGAVVQYSVRFTRPVVVGWNHPATIEVRASVAGIDSVAGTALIEIVATFQGQTVLAKARATVKLAG